jgi:hypothetical protein
VKGSWDNWQKEIKLEPFRNLAIDKGLEYQQFIKVNAGQYSYKYIVDGEWKKD